ncbi:Flagellar GTP-binding protein [Treponema sp. JC4]|nr:Flagellar GTP-binding protein [Treponema sp. JC4]
MLAYRKDERNQGRRPNLCFITTDFMRVGALQQLERFGDIMSYNVLKAEKTEDLKVLYDENKDNMDAIFIDTSGCSPNDATHLAQMKLLLDIPQMNPDIYLAVTASSKARDLENIFKNYEPFGYNSVIITKSDESLQYGNVISVLHKKHKAVSYITNGQNVTQDLRQASIVDFLIRLEGFDIDRQHIEGKFGGK